MLRRGRRRARVFYGVRLLLLLRSRFVFRQYCRYVLLDALRARRSWK